MVNKYCACYPASLHKPVHNSVAHGLQNFQWVWFVHTANETSHQSGASSRELLQAQRFRSCSLVANHFAELYNGVMVTDALGSGKASESAELITRELRQLIHPFLKPTVEEVGGLFGDLAHLGRERILKVLKKSQERLANSGIEPKPVELKTLVPMLQSCALEDDEDMAKRWANLLASAASADSIPPLFVEILSRLSPVEARLLDLVAHNQSSSAKQSRPYVNISAAREMSSLSPQRFKTAILALFQLGLVQWIHPGGSPIGGPVHWPPVQDDNYASTTILADEFLAACR